MRLWPGTTARGMGAAFWGFVLLVAVCSVPLRGNAQDAVIVAAASDLRFALDEIAGRFTKKTGTNVRISYGSSGNFARQIRFGAPFQIFLSADEGYIGDLAKAGLTKDSGELYAVGRLVFFVPKESPIRLDADMADLRRSLTDGRLKRFAIANPEHAPYGRAAKEALEHVGLWDAIHTKLVLGENVSQAGQFAASGSAQGGIFAYSLAVSPTFTSRGTYVQIPAKWHAPLRQRMVQLKSADIDASRFFAFIGSPESRNILRRYGFSLPGNE